MVAVEVVFVILIQRVMSRTWLDIWTWTLGEVWAEAVLPDTPVWGSGPSGLRQGEGLPEKIDQKRVDPQVKYL